MQSAKNSIPAKTQPPDLRWWAEFFEAGSFLRLSEGQILLWKGPFEPCAEPQGIEKDSKISMGYQEFFSSTVEFRLAQAPPLRLSVAQAKASLFEFQQRLKVDDSSLLRSSDFESRGYAEFEKNIQSILGKIQRGEIEKAVPVIFSRSKRLATVENVVFWMSQLLLTPPSLNVFGFWEKGIGIIGATPEILFRRSAGKLTTMALAGTMARSDVGKRNSLLKDPKELHEHQVVIEDLQHQLGKWGRVKKSETKILELPTLLHLQTLLEVENVNCGPREIMQQLHPTPALGLAPRAFVSSRCLRVCASSARNACCR